MTSPVPIIRDSNQGPPSHSMVAFTSNLTHHLNYAASQDFDSRFVDRWPEGQISHEENLAGTVTRDG